MSGNISYNNGNLSSSLARLAALRKMITSRLATQSKKLYPTDSEIQLLKRQNKLLKDHLNQQILLIERLKR